MRIKWNIARWACCAVLLYNTSAFATIVNLTPQDISYFQVNEEEVIYDSSATGRTQLLRFNVNNYSNLDITAFAVGVRVYQSWVGNQFNEYTEAPDEWASGLFSRYSNVFGDDGPGDWSSTGMEDLSHIWDAGYSHAYIAYSTEAAISAYTGMTGNVFTITASQRPFLPGSPVVILSSSGQQFIGGTSNDPNYNNTPIPNSPPSSVPEPATMLLFCTGLVGLVGMHRRKLKE